VCSVTCHGYDGVIMREALGLSSRTG
jgi:hypothetical protein